MAAAQRVGVRRVVAESVIFAYGCGTDGPALMDETDPYPGPPLPKGALADTAQSGPSGCAISGTAFGTTWLPLSNAKAKAELGWTPIPR